MAIIQIKGVNDYLIFLFDDEVCDDILFDSLRAMISSPSFKKKDFYPKAYFDFGKREVNHTLFLKLMSILEECESVLFCGFAGKEKKKKELLHIAKTIRNGEVEIYKEDVLFEGKINPGGHLIVYGNLYLLGSCQGYVEIIGDNVTCSASSLHGASVQINQYRMEDVSINEMTVFYVEDGVIQMKQEEFIYG